MNRFKFRVWSTRYGAVVYCDTQDQALRVLNMDPDADRVDYKCPGDWHGWRIVSGDLLNRVSISEIYRVDTRFDHLRAMIYIVAGVAFAALGVAAFL